MGLISRVSSRTYRGNMSKQSLLVKTKDGRVLELKDFINDLKSRLDKTDENKYDKTKNDTDKFEKNNREPANNNHINQTLSTSALNIVTKQEDDHKSPSERLEYQKRMDKLRAKIQQAEYEAMTKNVRTTLRPGFGKMIQEIGSASKLAYNHTTIAVSILASVLAFYFIPILLIPQTIPLGARVICGLVSATVILCIEILYYAKAFQDTKIKLD